MRSFRTLAAMCLACVVATGCQQEMARQPRYRPMQPSSFFADGRSARPLEPGTIPRGQLRDEESDASSKPTASQAAGLVGLAGQPLTALGWWRSAGQVAPDVFPTPLTERVLRRGREQFNIYCAVCHDRTGSGNGRIVQRGYVRPPSYHEDRLRQAPVGHFYQVITKGFGAMPDHAAQITPQDRWAIVAYIRALQASQNARLEDLPAEVRLKLTQEK